MSSYAYQRINTEPVNSRQRLVINRMMEDFKGHMTTPKYATMAKCSTNTALRDIRILLDREMLFKNPGSGKQTSYRLAPPDK